MNDGTEPGLEDLSLADLLERGREQTANLTFYKLVFNALDQLARDHAENEAVYRRSVLNLAAGFLATVKPAYLPQAVAAKNLLLKKASF